MAHEVAEIAQQHGGHISSEQLHGLGLSSAAIRHRAAQGTLIAVHHGVYAVGHLPTNPLDKAKGALLATGPRSALAFEGALAYWRRDRNWPTTLEFVSAQDRRPNGLKVHRCTTLLRRDIRTTNELRVTSPARTALDLAPRLTEHRRTRIVDELRHGNGLQVHQLRDVAERNPYHPGTKLILELVGRSQKQPTRSDLEIAFMTLIRKYALPIPEINVHVAGHRVDAHFPEHQLVVELDGRVGHADDWRPAFEQDRARVVDILEQTGLPTIRFTWNQLTRRQRQTATKLKNILAARAQNTKNIRKDRH